MPVTMYAEFEGKRARRLQPFTTVAPRQREQSQTRSIAVLGMALLFEQSRHERRRGRADLLRPVDQTLWGPFQMCAVGCGHVFDDGGVSADLTIPSVTRDTASAMQEFDDVSRDAGFELQTNERVGYAVAMLVDLDVVVDVYCGRLEASQFVGLQRQQ